MCMEDVRMMRDTGVATTFVNVKTTPTMLVGDSLQRVAIIVSAPALTRITLSEDPNVIDLNGIVLYASGMPLILDIKQVGNVITRRLFAVSQTSPQNVGFIEVFMSKE